MSEVLDWAERAWLGELAGTSVHPLKTLVGFEELAPGLGFMAAFSNAAVVDTAEGVVLLDTSSFFHAQALHTAVRGFSPRRLHTAVYTHGHIDHVFGLLPFEEEARAAGQRVRVIAHQACPARFDRYRLTRGYNATINARQFGLPVPFFPGEFRYPDETFDQHLRLELGETVIELHHDRGETDDHVWAYLPAQRALYTGDLFIWASPNCGNPQKVQRYPREWAAALRKMAALDVEFLLPGHGPPILGAARVKQALDDTATLLESLVTQTLALLNQGARLDEVLHSVTVPAGLLERPYLRPVYDDPLFIVRNLYRLYAGWWDGDPAHLKPPHEAELAAELVTLCGSAVVLAERALALLETPSLPLAGQLVEWALRAEPKNVVVREAYRRVNTARAEAETSLMAQAIFRAAVRIVEP